MYTNYTVLETFGLYTGKPPTYTCTFQNCTKTVLKLYIEKLFVVEQHAKQQETTNDKNTAACAISKGESRDRNRK